MRGYGWARRTDFSASTESDSLPSRNWGFTGRRSSPLPKIQMERSGPARRRTPGRNRWRSEDCIAASAGVCRRFTPAINAIQQHHRCTGDQIFASSSGSSSVCGADIGHAPGLLVTDEPDVKTWALIFCYLSQANMVAGDQPGRRGDHGAIHLAVESASCRLRTNGAWRFTRDVSPFYGQVDLERSLIQGRRAASKLSFSTREGGCALSPGKRPSQNSMQVVSGFLAARLLLGRASSISIFSSVYLNLAHNTGEARPVMFSGSSRGLLRRPHAAKSFWTFRTAFVWRVLHR